MKTAPVPSLAIEFSQGMSKVNCSLAERPNQVLCLAVPVGACPGWAADFIRRQK